MAWATFQQALFPLLATRTSVPLNLLLEQLIQRALSEGHSCPLALVLLADELIQYNTCII